MISYSIIQKSQLEGALRLDSEYYQPEFLDIQKKLKNLSSIKLGDISFVTDGEHGSPIFDEESGIKYFSSQFVMDGYTSTENIHYIDRRINERNRRSQLAEGDILLSIVGTIGKAAVVLNKDLPANSDRNVATIKIKDKSFLPQYIAVFLNSKLGRFQTLREIAGNVQPIIILSKIRELLIPIISIELQNKISTFYDQFLGELESSENLYYQAEQVLLKKLGLKDFELDDELYNVVNFSEVESVNRIDAEYFQPKYGKLVSKLKAQNAKELGSLVFIKKGVEPGSELYEEEGKLFIRVSNITKQGLVDGNQKYISEDLYLKLEKNYQPKEGEILLTKDATPGIAYVLKEQARGVLSGGILRLKIGGGIDAEYLALCINSLVGQMQAERDAGGSIIKHWRPEQIKNILIPILPKSTQQKIADLVHQSHKARREAKQLLEEAKQKVEELIEKEEK